MVLPCMGSTTSTVMTSSLPTRTPVRRCLASQPTARRNALHVGRRPSGRWHVHDAVPCRRVQRRKMQRSRASSSAEDSSEPNASATAEMTKEEAYKVLRLSEGASFERVVQAKNKMLSGGGVDADRTMQIEVAYDILLMESMKRRLSGESDVARSVRFADVPQPKKKQKQQPPTLPGNIRLGGPPQKQLLTQTGVFVALSAWTLAQALTAPANIPGLADQGVPGLQLALATGASVYFLRENKRASLGKAAGITAAGFLIGSILGGGLQSWLRVDIVPIGALSSPGALVGEFAILALYLSCTFLA